MSVLVQEKKPKTIQEVEDVINETCKDIVIRDEQVESKTELHHNGPEPQQILFRTPILAKKKGKRWISLVKNQNVKSQAGPINSALGMLFGAGCVGGVAMGLYVAASGNPNMVASPSGLLHSRHNVDTEELENQVRRWEIAQQILDNIGDGTVTWHRGREIYDESITMPIHNIRLSIQEMKQKFGLEWITFRDAVPVWSIIIDNLFRDGKVGQMNVEEQLSKLGDGTMCIMGEADNNDSYNRHDNKWSNCSGCSWLANNGLHLFSNYGNSSSEIYLTSEQGWQEYKDRFEYHWNVFHR